MTTRNLFAGAFASALTFICSLVTASTTSATTLSGSLAVVDQYAAFLSTDPTTLPIGPPLVFGSNWLANPPNSFGPVTLVAGQTYYLQILGIHLADDNNGAFVGQFNLSDSGFQFKNGTQTLLTEQTDWVGNLMPGGIWSQPTGSIAAFAPNSPNPLFWSTAYQAANGVGSIPNIDQNALFIWPVDALNNSQPLGSCAGPCVVGFMAEIDPTTTPIPAALPLFATGLGGLGLLGWRRKKRAVSIFALTIVTMICVFAESAKANTLTFNFDAIYNAAETAASTVGDTSKLTDYSGGLVDGVTVIHGSFTYDTSAATTFITTPASPVENIAQYPGGISFSIPSASFSSSAGITEVKDAITADTDSFFSFRANPAVALPLNHETFLGFQVALISAALNLYSSTALPTSFNLADFPLATVVVVQDDYFFDPSPVRVGHSELTFDITNLTEVPSTPLPAALPLFASGLGALGLLGWRRKKKAALAA